MQTVDKRLQETDMIDPETEPSQRSIYSKRDGRLLTLAMSDEFNTADRKFDHGADSIFEAVQKPDHTNEAIQFCKPELLYFLHDYCIYNSSLTF